MTKSTTAMKPASKPAKRRPALAECCDDACRSGARNRYFLGKRLTPSTFKLEQEYMVDRRRLLNRAIHGWGVVYGYPLATAASGKKAPDLAAGRIEIGPGLALDEPGRELVQTETLWLPFRSVTVLDKDKHPLDCSKLKEPAPEKVCWLLSVHYAERPISPLALKDPCSCETHEWDQVCETVHYTVRAIACSECCEPQPCELKCGCGTGPCCGGRPTREPPAEEPKNPKYPEQSLPGERVAGFAGGALSEQIRETLHDKLEELRDRPASGAMFSRGGCRCLCEHLTELSPDVECKALRPVKTDCGTVYVDFHNGVPLACVSLGVDECGNWAFERVLEDCGPRRLVKRNDLLFDLIRGCDLTRIKATGFGRWHRSPTPVPFIEFNSAFGDDEASGEVATREFWIEFTGPVRATTIRPDAFVMTVIHTESEGGWRETLRVPIVSVKTEGAQPGDPPGHARLARLVVDANWLGDAVRGRRTVFDRQITWVEILARGDYLIDCNGQRVDANIPGLRDAQTGNGAPGDDGVWTFPVGARARGDKEQSSKAY